MQRNRQGLPNLYQALTFLLDSRNRCRSWWSAQPCQATITLGGVQESVEFVALLKRQLRRDLLKEGIFGLITDLVNQTINRRLALRAQHPNAHHPVGGSIKEG